LKTQQITKAGRFSLISIGELLKTVNSKLQSSQPKKEILLEFLTRSDESSVKYVDVAYLQSLPENRNAVFQVASNFNGVEAISEHSFPTNPTFTEDYIYDHTQGPIASISAGGGAITRVHAAFYDPSKPQREWSQTDTRQHNFLKNLKEYFPVFNGYIVLQPESLPFPRDVQEQNKLLEKCYVGYHKNVQVTFGEAISRKFRKVNDPDQIIDQVFCAGMNMAQGSSGWRNSTSPNASLKASFILQSAYEGTYLTAITNDRKNIFLTMIGGGVFGNHPNSIYNAILDAHLKWGLYQNNSLEKVTVVLYYGDVPRWFEEKLKENNVNYKIVCYTNGIPTTKKSKL